MIFFKFYIILYEFDFVSYLRQTNNLNKKIGELSKSVNHQLQHINENLTKQEDAFKKSLQRSEELKQASKQDEAIRKSLRKSEQEARLKKLSAR